MFWWAYGIALTINLACYATLVSAGIQFIRLRSHLLPWFVGAMIAEALCLVAIFLGFNNPGQEMAVGFGVAAASVGLVFQFMVAFPLWAPILVKIARDRIDAPPEHDLPILFPADAVARPSDWVYAVVRLAVMFFVTSFAVGMAWRQFGAGATEPRLIGFGIPVAVSSVNAVVAFRLRRRTRARQVADRRADRLQSGRCPSCEYNLTGLREPRCPECGTALAPSTIPPAAKARSSS